MKALAKKMNTMYFDGAAPLVTLIYFGVPILLCVIIFLLLVGTLKLIKRARGKRLDNPPDDE